MLAARELYGVRPVDDAGVMPLFDALDQARILTASSVHQIQGTDGIRARVLRALSDAHQRLVGATTGLVLEAVGPFTRARCARPRSQTGELRDQVAKRRAQARRSREEVRDDRRPEPAVGSPRHDGVVNERTPTT